MLRKNIFLFFFFIGLLFVLIFFLPSFFYPLIVLCLVNKFLPTILQIVLKHKKKEALKPPLFYSSIENYALLSYSISCNFLYSGSCSISTLKLCLNIFVFWFILYLLPDTLWTQYLIKADVLPPLKLIRAGEGIL